MQSTRLRRCGRTAHPIIMAICCTTRIAVCRACQLFLERHTARRKGRIAGMPSADATTDSARAVVFRTYSSGWSMSGRMVLIMCASPAALARLLIISRPSIRT